MRTFLRKYFVLLLLIGFSTTLLLAQAVAPPPPDVTPHEAVKLVKKHKVEVLDVRTPDEFKAGHVRGAQNIDFKDPAFEGELAKLDTAKTYLVYCASGNRSSKAAALMRQKGLRKVINAGGMSKLQAAGAKMN